MKNASRILLPCFVILLGLVGCGSSSSTSDYAGPGTGSGSDTTDGSGPTATAANVRGETLVSATGDANTAQCPQGGSLLSFGLDNNGNDVLDASEISGSFPVCTGATGANGLNGNNGIDGGNGLNGLDGNKSLTGVINGILTVVDSQGKNVPILPSASVASSGQFTDANGVIWSFSQNQNGQWVPSARPGDLAYAANNCTSTTPYVDAEGAYMAYSVGSNYVYYTENANVLVQAQFPAFIYNGSCNTTYGVQGNFVYSGDMNHTTLPTSLPGTPPYRLKILGG